MAAPSEESEAQHVVLRYRTMSRAGPMACHFHWLATINDDQSIARLEAVLRTLRAQQRKIVWTVHNVLPHDQADVAKAVRARQS